MYVCTRAFMCVCVDICSLHIFVHGRRQQDKRNKDFEPKAVNHLSVSQEEQLCPGPQDRADNQLTSQRSKPYLLFFS